MDELDEQIKKSRPEIQLQKDFSQRTMRRIHCRSLVRPHAVFVCLLGCISLLILLILAQESHLGLFFDLLVNHSHAVFDHLQLFSAALISSVPWVSVGAVLSIIVTYLWLIRLERYWLQTRIKIRSNNKGVLSMFQKLISKPGRGAMIASFIALSFTATSTFALTRSLASGQRTVAATKQQQLIKAVEAQPKTNVETPGTGTGPSSHAVPLPENPCLTGRGVPSTGCAVPIPENPSPQPDRRAVPLPENPSPQPPPRAVPIPENPSPQPDRRAVPLPENNCYSDGSRWSCPQ